MQMAHEVTLVGDTPVSPTIVPPSENRAPSPGPVSASEACRCRIPAEIRRAGLDWALLPPDGGVQTYDPCRDDIGGQVLPGSGTWTIRVPPEGTATGACAFTLASNK